MDIDQNLIEEREIPRRSAVKEEKDIVRKEFEDIGPPGGPGAVEKTAEGGPGAIEKPGGPGAIEKTAEGAGIEQVCKIEQPTSDKLDSPVKKSTDKIDTLVKNPCNPPDGEIHRDEQKVAGLQLPLVSPIGMDDFRSNNLAGVDSHQNRPPHR